MKLLNKIILKPQLVLVCLMAFTVLFGLSCISAFDVNDTTVALDSSDSGLILNQNNDFTMSVKYTAGTAYKWEVSPETYGVEINREYEAPDDHGIPGYCGGVGTEHFNIHVTSEHYYVKLILVSPSGEIIDEVDSNMI